MIVHIDGNVNRYYVQMLCMVFFPGSTFGEEETPKDGVPIVDVTVYPDGTDSCTAYVRMSLNDRTCEATETVSYSENITIATHEAIAVGRAIFATGKELIGHIPPWGILTGIRPAKVAGSLLHNGKGINRAKKVLRDEYFVNPQKASLAVSVAVSENRLMKKVPKNSCSLYISIPFCPSRCAYCSFVSYTNQKLLSLIDEYIECLIADIKDTFKTIRKLGLRLFTIYIGGGTPTILSPKQLEKLLKTLHKLTMPGEVTEFTLEAGRPDTITKEKLSVAKKYGVTRVSVNPQTLSDDILREIGRRHTVEDFFRAYKIAKESGIRDINIDLIAGLPGDDFRNFSETVDRIIDLAPTNITVHTFCIKKAADVLRTSADVYSIHGGDAAKSVAYSQLKAKFAQYRPYYMYRQKNTVGNLENVGFSLEGHESFYNVLMMEEKQTIFAVGAGAVTKLVKHREDGEVVMKRIFHPKYPYEYLRDAKKNREGDAETQSTSSRIIEFLKTE